MRIFVIGLAMILSGIGLWGRASAGASLEIGCKKMSNASWMMRCENEEVVCYVTMEQSNMQCRFK